MKKVYESPMAEKIAFDYRNQVVAASGDNVENGGGTVGPGFTDINGDGQYGADDFLTDLFTMNFYSLCSR